MQQGPSFLIFFLNVDKETIIKRNIEKDEMLININKLDLFQSSFFVKKTQPNKKVRCKRIPGSQLYRKFLIP